MNAVTKPGREQRVRRPFRAGRLRGTEQADLWEAGGGDQGRGQAQQRILKVESAMSVSLAQATGLTVTPSQG